MEKKFFFIVCVNMMSKKVIFYIKKKDSYKWINRIVCLIGWKDYGDFWEKLSFEVLVCYGVYMKIENFGILRKNESRDMFWGKVKI